MPTRREFLVIPAGSYDHVQSGAEPPAAIGGWRLVTRQRHLGEIYEREGQGAPGNAAQSAVGSSGSRQFAVS